VVLTVNDRGPFANGRLIDVSRRAARELGFLENDLTKVRVEAVRGC
jgi:rare lipoprotein A